MLTSKRKIAIAVDLSDESAYAVKWAVQNYLRPGDEVILLHVQPTSVLYGADWGVVDHNTDEQDKFDAVTSSKSEHLAKPLAEAGFPYRIHIVKDHDMKERICLEVERLGVSAMVMGSRGFGASKVVDVEVSAPWGRMGSVSSYCVHHCECPVVVVRLPREVDVIEEEKEMEDASD